MNQQTNDLNYLLKRNKTLLGLSHEIKNSLSGENEILKEVEVKGEKPDDYIDAIKETINRTSNNITEIG